MTIYYLDSSAWIKRYCVEQGSERIAGFFGAGPAIGCAALGLVEVLATLVRKAKAREIAAMHMHVKCREAERDFALFHKVFLTPDLLRRACECAYRYGLRGADTVHLASCLDLRDRLGRPQIVLVSSDSELLTGARQCGIPAVDPEKDEIGERLAPGK